MPHDRATLGVLFYRGLELLRTRRRRVLRARARALARTAAQGYRATKMLDVVPVAMGLLAEAERRCGATEKAREIAREAATLLDEGSPSLLNEAPVFLALHDACVDLGDLAEARDGHPAAGSRASRRRVQGPLGHAVRARLPHAAPVERRLARRGRGLRARAEGARRDRERRADDEPSAAGSQVGSLQVIVILPSPL